MATLTRLRDAERKIVKTQRRLWLAQAALWPTVVLTGVSAVAVVVWRLRQQRAQAAETPPVDPATNGHLVHS